tara:strand:- start:14667 stop:15617 length:951 start_codon:yes stop_codon:yes gene_type:complete
MWFKVEDAKNRIANVITWTIDRTYDVNGDPSSTYGTITMASTGAFVGYTNNDVIQVCEFEEYSDTINNELRESVYVRIKTVTSNNSVIGEIFWPATTSVKKYGTSKVRANTITEADYVDIMLRKLLEFTTTCTPAQILAGSCIAGDEMVQGTDYILFKLAKGIYHAWYPMNSSNILTIINGKKHATIDVDSMYITTSNTYAYTDHSGAIVGPYGTDNSTVGHLGPYYNIADSLCEVLIACENTCSFEYGLSMDRWAEKIKRPPEDGGGGNNNNSNDDDRGGDDPIDPRDPKKDIRDKKDTKRPYKYGSDETSTRYK